MVFVLLDMPNPSHLVLLNMCWLESKYKSPILVKANFIKVDELG